MRTLLNSCALDAIQRWTARLIAAGSEVQVVAEPIGPFEHGDVLMVVNPAVNGFDTIRQFRQQIPAWMPLLAAVAESGPTTDELFKAGASDILMDGIETDDLRARLQSSLLWGERFRAEVEQQRQSQSSLASGLAHDFNNLLSAIQGNVDLSLMNPLISGELRYNLGQISKATDQAARLTRQVLDCSRTNESGLPPLNLNESLRQLRCGMMKAGVGERVEFSLDRTVPLVRMNHQVLSEGVRAVIQLALGILPVTGGSVEVATEVGPEGEAVLNVQTRGVEDASSLRMDSEGLAKAVSGLEAAGAKLSLPAPRGVRVSFPKPGKQAEACGSAATLSAKKALGTILVVDEAEAVRTATHRLLRREGYTVLVASSGDEGLELFRSIGGMIDAVILDLNLPGMDGSELVQHIRRIRPEIRVVVWSGMPLDEARSRLNGVADVALVQKPRELAEFPGMLNRILQG